ncbi:hypothetical protein CsSME_00008809 [Camellia sinensis var. sinensis]
MGEYKQSSTRLVDGNGNTLLHLVGNQAPIEKLNVVPGAALQMHRELQWFKEVEKFVNPSVDTLFLIVLKTWTSSFEHSVIILVRVRLEFPEVSATRPASGSLNSTVLCLVLHQTLVVLLLRVGSSL